MDDIKAILLEQIREAEIQLENAERLIRIKKKIGEPTGEQEARLNADKIKLAKLKSALEHD
ncbi:MAG: hypothetical protein ACTSQ8_24760 [Candidatus Helarchaeota archaeon]